MKIVVIIPTYNEKDNVESIIKQVFEQAKHIPNHELHVLIVDDNSPDGTGSIVEKMMQTNTCLHLLKGEKQGLGAAYVRGFKEARANLHADVVMEMDADGSHPPSFIPAMIKAIDDGADVAVGTRYIKGGSIPNDWGITRKFLSQVGNIIARVVLFLPQYHDMTTGFRATRTSMLQKVNLDGLLSKRFAYKIHLFHALHMAGAKIVEVPFAFVDREKGYSKMPRNEIIDSLRVVFSIRLYESRQLVKFLIVGTIGFTVNAVILYILDDTAAGFFLPSPETQGNFLMFPLKDTRLFWATVISGELSIFSNFIFHERWTFKHRDKSGNDILRFLKFNVSSIVSPIISIVTVNILTPHFGLPKIISLGIGTLLGLIWNYTVNVLLIWRERKEV